MSWGPAEVIAVIAALSAAIVTIIHVWRTKGAVEDARQEVMENARITQASADTIQRAIHKTAADIKEKVADMTPLPPAQ